MELEPVEQYQKPKLPTGKMIGEHPELLRLIPRRWQTNPVVLTALTCVCTLMLESHALIASQPASTSRIAPLFRYGEGRASFGGDMAIRHSFLSEEEARKIIEDEALNADISFTPDIHSVDGMNVPRPDRSDFSEEREEAQLRKIESYKPPTSKAEKFGLDENFGNLHKEEAPIKELVFDGTDKKRSIHYEYVSEYDINQWDTKCHEGSPFEYYDIRPTADALRQGLVECKPEGVYAVFYDPLVSVNRIPKVNLPEEPDKVMSFQQHRTKIQMTIAAIEQASGEELRKQVQDFIKWLKSQGVI